jgi:hypothetical protein
LAANKPIAAKSRNVSNAAIFLDVILVL